jgi:hypothetical protein
MTEAEWLSCSDPDRMLEYLAVKRPTVGGWLARLGFRREPEPEPEPPQLSTRKLQLYACACCRRIGHLLTDERSQQAVEVAERYADGLATEEERRAAESAAWDALTALLREPITEADRHTVSLQYQSTQLRPRGFAARAAMEAARGATEDAVAAAVRAALEVATGLRDTQWAARAAGAAARADLLRELVGNPLRPAVLDPAWLAWRGGTLRRIARAAYDEYRFEELPVLADALEEAGCTDPVILGHCRDGGDHVRGCWLVDLLLGAR